MKRLLQTQESVSPYQSVLAPGDDTEVHTCRAIYVDTEISNAITCTFADGTTADLEFAVGIYQLALKKVSLDAGLVFLY
jgi:hypothetical protein